MAETILLYGESDGGKTAQLAHFAKFHHDRTGEITRAIIADTTIEPLRPWVIGPDNPDGIVEVLAIRGMADPWNRLDKLAGGWWPRLAPQADGSYKLIFQPPQIDKTPGKADGKADRILSYASRGDQQDPRKVGQIFVEGLSTVAELLLQDHADHAKSRPMWGSGQEGVTMFESIAEVETAPGKVIQDKIEIGRAVGGHYGSVQRWMLNHLIPRFAELRTVERVVWTAHTGRGQDKFTGIAQSALGPATVGQATVDTTTRLFGHAFHLETDTSFDKDGNVARRYRAWFISHPDEIVKVGGKGLPWPAKVSVPDAVHRELLKKFPKGYVPLDQDGLAEQFLGMIHKADQADKE